MFGKLYKNINEKYYSTRCIEIPNSASNSTITIQELKAWIDSLNLPYNTKLFLHSSKGVEKTLIGTYTQPLVWCFLAFSYSEELEYWRYSNGSYIVKKIQTN